MKAHRYLLFLVIMIFLLGFSTASFAADHVNPSVEKDSQGFYYYVWLDYREGGATGESGTSGNIYAQKFDSLGNKQWSQDVRINVSDLYYLWNWEPTPRIAVDNNDNIYIVWGSSYKLYVQKLNTNGVRQWTTDKQANVNQTPEYLGFDIDCDNNGNVYVVFQRYGPAMPSTYLQKLDSNGTPQWASDVYAGVGGFSQLWPYVEVSQDNSVFVTHKSTSLDGVPIRKFDSGGTGIWYDTIDGGGTPAIATDSNSNCIVAYKNGYEIFVQKYTPAGAKIWAADKQITNDGFSKYDLRITNDSADNIFLTWKDKRAGNDYDIIAQKLNSSGVKQWAEEKIANIDDIIDQEQPDIMADNSGGCYVTWFQPTMGGGGYHIFMNKFSSSGNRIWEDDKRINTDDGYASDFELYSDAGLLGNSTIYVWSDADEGSFNGIYNDATAPEGSQSFQTSHTSWAGWGIFPIGGYYNLSAYSSGYLKFWVKSNTDLKIEMEDPSGKTVKRISAYGWDGTGTWQKIQIPVADFGKNLAMISSPFLVTMDQDPLDTFYIDHIRWSTTAAANHDPVIISTPVTTTVAGQLYQYDVNATDEDGDTLTYSLTNNPSGMTINTISGLIAWSPTESNVGTFNVSVLVDDNNGGSATQDYTLEVTSATVNYDPVITSTPVLNAYVGQLYQYDVEATDANGDTLNFACNEPLGFTINSSTGLLSGTPGAENIGTHFVYIFVDDGNGGWDEQLYDLVVTEAVNQAPVITSSPVLTATEDLAYQYDVNATDEDGDTLSYSLTMNPSEMTINASSGLISWNPTQADVGNHGIIVNVDDSHGGIDSQSYTLTVANINDIPVIISSPVTSTAEDQTYHYDTNATDEDGDTLTYSLTQNPSGMTINTSSGLISWNPVQANVGNHAITFQVSDGNGGTDTQSYTLTVINVNDAPVITSGPAATPNPVDEDATSTITVTCTDEDGDNLTYSWNTTGGSISGTGNSVTYNPPDVSAQTSYTITITVSDGHGGTDSATTSITVKPAGSTVTEQTPWSSNETGTEYTGYTWNYTMGYHFTPQCNGAITKLGGSFGGAKTVYLWNKDTGQLLAQADVSSSYNWSFTNINPVAVNANTNYTVAAFIAGSGGSYRRTIDTLPRTYGDIDINGSCYYYGNGRPTNNITIYMYGQADICFVPGDGTGNNPPSITSSPVTSAMVETLYTYNVLAADADGDNLTYSLTTYPAGMIINATTGTITWTPDSTQAGPHNVEIKVEDTEGASVIQNYTISVSSVLGEQTPWSTNGDGTTYTGYAWNYTMGYHFTPQTDGQIIKLGGNFNGEKTVYLWNKATGELLAQAEVTSSYNWAYTYIDPVSVQAGVTYTVAAYIAGSGGSYQIGITILPQTYDDITINGACYYSGNGRPTNTVTTRMYGQADICFVPGGGGIEENPWDDNENGSLYVGFAWNYTLGYHFTPETNGQITKLYGFFNGEKTVFLWDKDTGELLAQANLTSANQWTSASITPVNVQAGKNYTIAVVMAGSGGTYRSNIQALPQTYGNVTITGSTYLYGNGRPTNTVATSMYGQVDIGFVAQ